MGQVSDVAPEAEAKAWRKGGMTAAEAAYMQGGKVPVAGSVPMSTSKFLNSPLFVHAYSLMSLRRLGRDVPFTYDIPIMSRALDDVADYAEASRLIAVEKLEKPDFAAWLEKRQLTHYDAEALARHAPGTLGAEIHAFIAASGYEMEFVHAENKAETDLQYLVKRMGQTHDIQHMVTGFGPNVAGEQALAIMNVTATARYFSPRLAGFISMPNLFVSSAGYMRAGLHHREGMPLFLEATRLGIAAGEAIRLPLLMVPWEEYLDWPIDDIRADLGFVGGPGSLWTELDYLMQDSA